MTIQERVSLKKFSAYKVGGPARYFCSVDNENDLRNAVNFAKNKHLQIFILGGGSNLIISDKGFDGLVVKIFNSQFQILGSDTVEAGGGISMSELVKRTSGAGLAGLEWAGGLPGTLGGAIFGNAGCFGREIKDVVVSVRAARIMNYELGIMNYASRECDFSYRSSRFKKEKNLVIVSALLKLTHGDPQELQKAAQEKIEYRKSRHPLEYPNIGSIFKNIDDPKTVTALVARFPDLERDVKERWHGKIPTAVLIEKSGLAGKRAGGAQISEKHANFIINRENAKAADIITLIQEVKATIQRNFGIALEEEVRYVGFE